MGKKEVVGHQSVVDRYRKNIGKQDYKKSKNEVKESVNKAQMKRSAKQIYQINTLFRILNQILLRFLAYAMDAVFKWFMLEINEISLMVGAMLFVFFSLYAIFYLVLTKEGKKIGA